MKWTVGGWWPGALGGSVLSPLSKAVRMELMDCILCHLHLCEVPQRQGSVRNVYRDLFLTYTAVVLIEDTWEMQKHLGKKAHRRPTGNVLVCLFPVFFLSIQKNIYIYTHTKKWLYCLQSLTSCFLHWIKWPWVAFTSLNIFFPIF
jgi:hypothetical protein